MIGALEKFAEHFIAQHPCLSDGLTGVLIIMLFIVSPVLVFVLLSERYNKNRYVFQIKDTGAGQREHLYLLDTMKGHLYWVDGKAIFCRLHERDWKKEHSEDSTPTRQ